MKTLRLLVFVLLFFPALSQAGEIYGTIKIENGNPLIKKEIKIISAKQIEYPGTTDANGYFSISVNEIGKCKLTIVGFTDVSFDVFSSTKSTRYNLLLKKEGDKWILKSL